MRQARQAVGWQGKRSSSNGFGCRLPTSPAPHTSKRSLWRAPLLPTLRRLASWPLRANPWTSFPAPSSAVSTASCRSPAAHFRRLSPLRPPAALPRPSTPSQRPDSRLSPASAGFASARTAGSISSPRASTTTRPSATAFPGYRLLETARALGIPNATHNNTRGCITRLLEEELVRRRQRRTPRRPSPSIASSTSKPAASPSKPPSRWSWRDSTRRRTIRPSRRTRGACP